MSKVSIITPIYNVKGYLAKCIESALNQTEKDIELVLVDDGSTDGSGEICDEYAAKDLRVKVVHKENGGVSDTRNVGIRSTTSDYIMFLDSDDTYETDTVETALKAIKKENADIAVFDYHAVDENRNELYKVCTGIHGCTALAETPEILLTAPALWNKIFKKELFENVSFPKDYWYEDLRIVSKMYIECKKIAYIDCNPLYNYLIRSDSIMHSKDVDKVKTQRIIAANDVRDFYIEHKMYEQLKAELDWLYIYHGYFLPCREIMSYSDKAKTKVLMNELHKNLDAIVPDAENSKYFCLLNKRERMLYNLFYSRKYKILNLMLSVKEKM